MELSHEDQLRLHVLMQSVQAVRIDEQNLTVYGLSAKGEAKVSLKPTVRADQYVRLVRQFLAGIALGSPRGFPVHLQRWTRMGQLREDANLEVLLMLGEPEAITALVCAPHLTDELARRAWWAAPISENARHMLRCSQVVASDLGKELAEFLIEHLAFENEPAVIVETVRLVLQAGLIDEQQRLRLWNKGKRTNIYRLGFLLAGGEPLPESVPERADYRMVCDKLADLSENPAALLLQRVLSDSGRSVLVTLESLLAKPADQDVAVLVLNTLGDYFRAVQPTHENRGDMAAIVASTQISVSACAVESYITEVLQRVPELLPEVTALLILSQVDDDVVTDIFAHTTAVGTLMRDKMAPVTEHIFKQLKVLLGSV